MVVLQRLNDDGITMDHVTLAYCKQLRKQDGAVFLLGANGASLSNVEPGTTIHVRVLRNFNMLKTHLRAISALHRSEDNLNRSFISEQLLQGRIDPKDMQTLDKLDQWIKCQLPKATEKDHPSTPSKQSIINLQDFNKQQQRALALEALCSEGVVLVQGPPGTGKSHIVCHGIMPQAVARNEKILVVCNSNVAVDALLLKCTHIDSLQGCMLRCGFKQSVSDDIVNLGLYAEGDVHASLWLVNGSKHPVPTPTLAIHRYKIRFDPKRSFSQRFISRPRTRENQKVPREFIGILIH